MNAQPLLTTTIPFIPVFPTPEHYRNILFLLPQPADASAAELEHTALIEMARYCARHAYVYVARSTQHDWEDDEFGVRYLPLDCDRLPCFGTLTKAFVWQDRTLAQAVAAEHPDAEVVLLQSPRCISHRRAEAVPPPALVA